MYGVGGVGLCIVQACSVLGADPMIVVDLADEKLEFAKTFGATITINGAREDPVERIKQITNGGADFAFDAIGAQSTMEQILPSVKQGIVAIREGGTAVLVGVPQTPATLQMRDFFLARTYNGSFGGSSRPDTRLPDVPAVVPGGQAAAGPAGDASATSWTRSTRRAAPCRRARSRAARSWFTTRL